MDVKVIFVLLGTALMLSLLGTGTAAAKTKETGSIFGDPVEAVVDFDPDVINLKSGGKFVTCWISVPGDYDAEDIVRGSISIVRIGGDAVSLDALGKFHRISDHDGDGSDDLMVKFDREELIDDLDVGDDISIMVTGRIGYEDLEGIGLIRAINPPEKEGDGWSLLYSSDFSTDPSWVTNAPAKYFWDSYTGTYFASMVDKTSTYSCVGVDYNFGSFTFELDFKLYSLSWAGDFSFGLYGPSMTGPGNPDQMIEFTFGNGGFGFGSGLQVMDANGVWRTDVAYPISTWSLNTWYHLVIEYDVDTGVVKALMTDMNGNTAQSCSISGVSGFDDISCIALSKIVGWFTTGATANGCIDNVSLSEYTA
ncbi:MAG: hypothetical protein ACMUIG_08605 [Thermoplasmatota archaeon]